MAGDRKVEIIKKLLLVNALFWLGFGVIRALLYFDKFMADPVIQTSVLVTMFGNGFAFLVLVWGIEKWFKLFSWLSLIYVIINFVLTITDQFGVWDFLILLLNGVTILFLIKLLIKNGNEKSNG